MKHFLQGFIEKTLHKSEGIKPCRGLNLAWTQRGLRGPFSHTYLKLYLGLNIVPLHIKYYNEVLLSQFKLQTTVKLSWYTEYNAYTFLQWDSTSSKSRVHDIDL